MTKVFRRRTKLFVYDGAIYSPEKKGQGKEVEEYDVYRFMYVDILCIYQDIVTLKITMDLTYLYNDETHTIRVPRSILTRSEILKYLPSYGLDVSDENAKYVLEWLLFREQNSKIIFTHEVIGWSVILGEKVYLLDEVISKLPIASTYVGNLSIAPVGTLVEHLKILAEEVRGNHNLELAYCIGMSAILFSYLKETLGIAVGFFHFWGYSSTGKTVSAMLASSPYGKPSKSKTGLIISWSGTDNSISAYMKNKHGFLFAIDESSSRSNKSYSENLYFLVDGMSKNRSTIEGNMRPREEYSGAIVSTGETSILDESSQNQGLRMRILELGFRQWTTSAMNAKRLYNNLVRNFGHTARLFARYVIDLGEEEVYNKFEAVRKVVLARMKEVDRFSDRSSDKISVVYLSAIMVNEVLNLGFDPDKILEIMIDAESESLPDRDIASKAYDYILDMVSVEQSMYYRWENDEVYRKNNPGSETIHMPIILKGRIDKNKGIAKVIFIQKDILDEILKQGKFISTAVVVKAMKEKGFLYTDNGGKSQVNRKIYRNAASRSRVYGIKLAEKDSEKISPPELETTRALMKNDPVPRKQVSSKGLSPIELFADNPQIDVETKLEVTTEDEKDRNRVVQQKKKILKKLPKKKDEL